MFDPNLTTLLSFVATCVVIEITPGPNMGYLAVLSATEGRRSGLAATAGVALGLLSVGLATALGLASVISASPMLYQALRWAGIAYLLWLAWEGWTQAAVASSQAEKGVAGAKYFTRGLVTNLLNPKAALFYVAVLPSFVDPMQPVMGQTVLLTFLYVTVATVLHSAIVVLSGTVQAFLTNAHREQLVRRGLSLVLVGIAVWFAWSSRS